MKITHGLMTGQVLQRNAKELGGARLEGSCKNEGPVEARVLAKKSAVKGLNWHKVGSAQGRKFTASLQNIPSGGPYTVELRIGQAESLAVADVYVGDVWFLGGQSNMQGVGNINEALKPHPLVRAFYMRDEWGQAEEPLHLLQEAVDEVHRGAMDGGTDIVAAMSRGEANKLRKTMTKGTCPGLPFALEMLKRSGVPQGIVLCAHGGTSMSQWAPAKKDQGGRSLYGAMLRRFQVLGQPIRGVMWYQGESDATDEAAPLYTQRMEEFVAAVRADFGQANLPFVVVQIGRVIWPWPPYSWNSIQDQQRRLPASIANLEVVPTIDLELDDGIHISGNGMAILGGRLARMADRLAYGNKKEKGSLRIAGVELYERTGKLDPIINALVVKFDNVVGGLQSAGRPVGFSFHDAKGEPQPAVVITRLQGDRAIIETTVDAHALDAFSLKYGHGLDPVCSITDGRGMGVPVLGPIPIRVIGGTPFLMDWKVRGPEVIKGGIRKATLVVASDDAWRAPYKSEGFLNMPQDITMPQEGIFHLRTRVTARQALNVLLSMSADSPFRVWLNGKAVATEVDATNPCLADAYKYPVKLRQGENEIVVAFDGRAGRGWGVGVRLLPVSKDEPIPEGAIQL